MIQAPKVYEKIASHYLEKAFSKEKFSSVIASLDDVSIYYNGKDTVKIEGVKGNFIAKKVENKIEWEYIKQEKKDKEEKNESETVS